MGVRKSKKIGKVIKGYRVIDSRRKGNDTELFLECLSCKNQYWKNKGFLRLEAKCPYCQGGRNYRNAEGYTKERLYARYRNIIRRVRDPRKYDGVGICSEWENDYLSFREWALNNGYDDSLTIDRIDNDKGYSPDNCRWVTLKQQANNRSNNTLLEYEGKQYTISEFAEFAGLSYSTVLQRINRNWSLEDTIKTPYKSRKKWSEENEKIEN